MAAVTFNRFKFRTASGLHDWDATAKTVLVLEVRSTTAGADVNPDLNTLADLLAVAGVAEAAGTGYVRKALATPTAAQDDANNRAVLDAVDVTWAGANWGDVRLIVVCETADGVAGNMHLVSAHDGGLPAVTNGGDFTYAWAAAGLIAG